MKTPYTPLFATDFLAYKDAISADELKTILSIASEVALWNQYKTAPSSLSPIAFSYLQMILTALNKAKKKSEAGEKGGRPAEKK